MIISLIAALSENRVIGKNNDLPWSLPDDMKYFMETTSGTMLLWAGKTMTLSQKSLGPPNRTNLVVTRQPTFIAPGCTITNSVEEAISIAQRANERELFVIGGAEVYQQTLHLADRLYLTEIKSIIEGNVFFPEYNKSEWQEVSRLPHNLINDKHKFAFDFVVYHKRTNQPLS